jgi:hypothetical protein
LFLSSIIKGIRNIFRIEVPQLPVDGIFQPTTKRSKRRTLRPLDESKTLEDTRTEEEMMAGKFSIHSFIRSLDDYFLLI